MTKACPNCKLVNPPEAVLCDCGFDFASQKMPRAIQQRRARFPFCTAAAGIAAIAGTAWAVSETYQDVMSIPLGSAVRFVGMGGMFIAGFTFLLTLACALGGMLVERRIGLNFIFICFAISAIPLCIYTVDYTAHKRSLTMKE